MARKKTKKEKKKTQVKRETTGEIYSTSPKLVLNDDLLSTSSKKTSKRKSHQAISFGYDPKLILSDLRKTLMLSALVFAIEIGLFIAKEQGLLESLFN